MFFEKYTFNYTIFIICTLISFILFYNSNICNVYFAQRFVNV